MPILSEWELWACAKEYLHLHGVDAPVFAAMRADKLLERGDLDGAQNWRLIVKRTNDLLERTSGAVH